MESKNQENEFKFMTLAELNKLYPTIEEVIEEFSTIAQKLNSVYCTEKCDERYNKTKLYDLVKIAEKTAIELVEFSTNLKDFIPKHCGKTVAENLYHRATDAGALWYCWGCDGHFDKNMKELKWDESKEQFIK